MRLPSSPCPGPCARSVRPGHLLCGPCWAEVPKPMRREVWRTWSAYQSDPSDAHWFEYVDAREAALQAVAA